MTTNRSGTFADDTNFPSWDDPSAIRRKNALKVARTRKKTDFGNGIIGGEDKQLIVDSMSMSQIMRRSDLDKQGNFALIGMLLFGFIVLLIGALFYMQQVL